MSNAGIDHNASRQAVLERNVANLERELGRTLGPIDTLERQLAAARAKLQRHIDELVVYELDDSPLADGIVVDTDAAEAHEAEMLKARAADLERVLVLAGSDFYRVAMWGDDVARVEKKTRGHDGRYLSTGDYQTDELPVAAAANLVLVLNVTLADFVAERELELIDAARSF